MACRGDFNVVMNRSEKISGNPVSVVEMEDFRTCFETSDLLHIPFRERPYTWWNGRAGMDCIFERLDRIASNSEFQNPFSSIDVEHLARIGQTMSVC